MGGAVGTDVSVDVGVALGDDDGLDDEGLGDDDGLGDEDGLDDEGLGDEDGLGDPEGGIELVVYVVAPAATET